MEPLSGRSRILVALVTVALLATGASTAPIGAESAPSTLAVLAIGDSLTHGTMDATNNSLNTSNAYVQRVRNALVQRVPLAFGQPWFDFDENRIDPTSIPTNLGVDGADSFTIDGLTYHRRAGTDQDTVESSHLCDKLLPRNFSDKYDKVLYPINILARQSTSQLSSLEYLLRTGLPSAGVQRAVTMYWVGNNDSSTAALGEGGSNPMFLPIPAQQLFPRLPGISLLMQFAISQGALSIEPYSAASIDRNLTTIADFTAQQQSVLTRLVQAGHDGGVDNQIFILTLPYYSSVGYLMDSEDLEFYLGKANPDYRVPPSFKRVAPRGQPITDPLAGDRISLLTFGLMYALLDTGVPVAVVNGALETNGVQRDGLVLSEAEGQTIRDRIDAFNASLRTLAAAAGPNVHVVEVGPILNGVLTGKTPITVGGHAITRKWMRGSAFGFDGVHPNYVGHTLIADLLISRINAELGLDAPLTSLDSVIGTDPYIDRDGDGWAAGPHYTHAGISDLLFLFKDPDDTDATKQVVLPPDVWDQILKALLSSILTTGPEVRAEAQRLGLTPAN